MPPAYLDPYWCFAAEAALPGVGAASLAGDETAAGAVWDYGLDHLEIDVHPFEVGRSYLIQTVTLYYVGRVAEIRGAFLVLESASWVHWTGRLSTLIRRLSFAAKGWPAGDRRPRTEYVGRHIVGMTHIVGADEGEWDLPTESVQS